MSSPRRKSCAKHGVRTSGPKVKSGPRKGKFHCYKSKASAKRARSRRSNSGGAVRKSKYQGLEVMPRYKDKSPCRPFNKSACALNDQCAWMGKRKCIRKPRNRASYWSNLSGAAAAEAAVVVSRQPNPMVNPMVSKYVPPQMVSRPSSPKRHSF